MIKRVKSKITPTKFQRVYEVEIGNFTITKGEIIKIQDEHGMKFKFDSLVTNTETGVQWIDCFEMHKVTAGCFRSFRLDRIKRIPARRGRRKKNVV
jgi:hypothetical protein